MSQQFEIDRTGMNFLHSYAFRLVEGYRVDMWYSTVIFLRELLGQSQTGPSKRRLVCMPNILATTRRCCRKVIDSLAG